MKNKERIDYIEEKLKTKFKTVDLVDTRYLNEQSSSFYAKYSIGEYSIIFVKDRGFLEVELLKNEKYTLLENLNCDLINLKFNEENINKAIQFLSITLSSRDKSKKEE
ncbi:hypothetical protein FF125_20315 [Aureibaculum algae]|mgnify:CR=1 FL=1|uniref:Uncharacterized protein n=1 Tax=Aureibaculum algae TaxID=2584122 RepID=A0A5B7TWF1_9FLAO|nr:hypothetical protein [Aureibaculum algae]QCX40670.1 hypothetical protein FF125_20315 [Aureibaculum algae]